MQNQNKSVGLMVTDAPKQCQSCGEDRVLDIAHKPDHKRNGSWRSKKNTSMEKVWILCPTCHALIDRNNYDPFSLGLS
jgi:5-methylcytosine-specific restriction endonuclease McrA